MANVLQGMTVSRWSGWPLKRLFFAITTTVLVFLTLVLVLGIRQYLLYDQCQQAVTDADRLLFQFTSIKDHLNESLILGEDINLHTLNGELQHLEKEVEGLKGNVLVPERLKGPLPSRVDLVGMEVRLRAIQEQRRHRTRETAELVRTLNGVNISLQQFRFLLSDHTQTVLVGLHRIIVGTMGLIVVLSCTLLYLLNRHLAAPIITLCQLTASSAQGESDQSLCSMEVLVARLRRLLEGKDPLHLQGEDSGFANPVRMQQESIRYRHAVTGSISTELASELTNCLNGIINYTQTLIDIGQQGGNRQREADLCQSLVKEEKKTADLVAALQRIGQWQSARSGSSIALAIIFRMVALFIEKTLCAEAIVLNLPTDCRHAITVPAGDLWLVLLTLLQQGRRALSREATGVRGEKWLRVQCLEHPDNGNRRLHLVLTSSVAAWHDDRSDSVWPSSAFCTHLLRMHDASLTIEATSQGDHFILDLPCHIINA